MRRRGFTIIELVAVVIILALLSAVAVSRVFDYRERAKVSAEAGVVRAVRGAISMSTGRGALSGAPNPAAALDTFASGTVASQYSQIVVIMAGTKAAEQILSWRNISFTKAGP